MSKLSDKALTSDDCATTFELGGEWLLEQAKDWGACVSEVGGTNAGFTTADNLIAHLQWICGEEE